MPSKGNPIVAARFPHEEHQLLRDLAEQQGLSSPGDLVRKLTLDWLDSQRQAAAS